jgi:DNA-damage-inducible protein J
MTTLNVRIEEKTKHQAAKVLDKMGLDMSSAIKIFLKQVIKDDGLPFIPSNKAKTIRERWDKEVSMALKQNKGFTSAKELHKSILGKHS